MKFCPECGSPDIENDSCSACGWNSKDGLVKKDNIDNSDIKVIIPDGYVEPARGMLDYYQVFIMELDRVASDNNLSIEEAYSSVKNYINLGEEMFYKMRLEFLIREGKIAEMLLKDLEKRSKDENK